MPDLGLVSDLRTQVEIPDDGILSRTVHAGDGLTLVVFGFDAGQELSEHTSTKRAIIEILDGEAEITLDGEVSLVGAGAWIAMPAGMRHAIRAATPMRMALTLF